MSYHMLTSVKTSDFAKTQHKRDIAHKYSNKHIWIMRNKIRQINEHNNVRMYTHLYCITATYTNKRIENEQSRETLWKIIGVKYSYVYDWLATKSFQTRINNIFQQRSTKHIRMLLILYEMTKIQMKNIFSFVSFQFLRV